MEDFLTLIEEHWVVSVCIAAFIIILMSIILAYIALRSRKALRIEGILMSISFFSIITLTFFTVCKMPEDGAIDLTILTVSFALATIVPYIVGSSFAKSEVHKIVDEKFKVLENEYSTSLFTLTKQNAHAKRLSANLLKETHPKWAIGWVAEALISYSQIQKRYDQPQYINECIETLHALTDKVMNPDYTMSHDEDKEINKRTLRSLLTMHAYISKNHNSIFRLIKKRRDNSGNNNFDILKIECTLLERMHNEDKDQCTELINYLDSHKFKQFCESCRVSDLNDKEINDNIIKTVNNIVENIKEYIKRDSVSTQNQNIM